MRKVSKILSVLALCVCVLSSCMYANEPTDAYVTLDDSSEYVLSDSDISWQEPFDWEEWNFGDIEDWDFGEDTESWGYDVPQSEYYITSSRSWQDGSHHVVSSYEQGTVQTPSVSSAINREGTSSKANGTASSGKTPSNNNGTSSSASTSSKQAGNQGDGNTATTPAVPNTPVTPTPAPNLSTASSKPAAASSAPSAPKTYTGTITVKTPAASGTTVYQNGGVTVDASHMSDGYIMVKCVSSAPRVKLQIIFGDYTYNYDLNKNGNYEVFPLQGGSTSYKVRVLENVSGTKYREAYSVTLNAQISNANSPFLYPSQYVNFSASSSAVKKSYDLCVGASNELQKIEAIYSYITAAISYDSVKASQAQSGQLTGYLPNVDDTLSSGKGICFDYAALMAAMLRAQNIPVKLIIGTVAPGNVSHAWNLVYTREKGWIAFKIEFKGNTWKLMDSTFGAAKGQNIEQYIGNGSNYTQLRVY